MVLHTNSQIYILGRNVNRNSHWRLKWEMDDSFVVEAKQSLLDCQSRAEGCHGSKMSTRWWWMADWSSTCPTPARSNTSLSHASQTSSNATYFCIHKQFAVNTILFQVAYIICWQFLISTTPLIIMQYSFLISIATLVLSLSVKVLRRESLKAGPRITYYDEDMFSYNYSLYKKNIVIADYTKNTVSLKDQGLAQVLSWTPISLYTTQASVYTKFPTCIFLIFSYLVIRWPSWPTRPWQYNKANGPWPWFYPR